VPNKVIIAPHPDDEIIGCFSMIHNNEVGEILYITDFAEPERINAGLCFCAEYGIIGRSITFDQLSDCLSTHLTYFPSPFDFHAHHKIVSAVGLMLAEKGKDVGFYSIEKNLINLPLPPKLIEEKRKLLDTYYPSQKKLWDTNEAYLIFEYIWRFENYGQYRGKVMY